MADLTPREIVAELDRHIIGQLAAKRAVASAVRQRWRRQRLDDDLAREVAPRNIIMVGPTGVGKTEIARRLAGLVGAPFIKVEASKYTEVGYHGRDVESMIRDLLELAIKMVREEHAERVREEAEFQVEERLVDLLLGDDATTAKRRGWVPSSEAGYRAGSDAGTAGDAERDDDDAEREQHLRVRARMKDKLREGFFDEREIEIAISERKSPPILGMMGPDQFDPAVSNMLEGLMPEQTKRRRVTVARARAILLDQETEKLVDDEKIVEQAIERTEETGIVFLDEIDKIASGRESRSADVSREGVQRDLLPIVEGSSVTTRHGTVKTDHVLFVAAGAFHVASVSDLMPELQGRFPIRVELDALDRDDFRRILTEPDASLLRQQSALLATEGLDVTFTEGAIAALADVAAEANQSLENIGARRLVTVVERVLEETSFDAPAIAAGDATRIEVDEAFVRERLAGVLDDANTRRYVL